MSRQGTSRKAAQTQPDIVAARLTGHVVGSIARVDADGAAWVNFPNSPTGAPVLARSIIDAPAAPLEEADYNLGQSVLLVFEDNDPALPIICGIIRKRLQPPHQTPVVRLDSSAVRDVLVDGRQLVFQAGQQILLRCGKSSVLLRRDGKVVIRGTNLLSRSSGSNKIKGASIDLN